MKRVVVIGGGIAGLATAYSLREHQLGSPTPSPPFETVIIEKKSRVGGNIVTEKIDGFVVEGGPDCFISEKPWAMELCRRIGLEDRLLPTNDEFRKTYVLSGGRLHELPEGVILMVPTKILPLATSSLISIPGKVRMALEAFVPKKKDPGDESLGDFVRRRLGKEALDKIAEPLVAGIHAGDPETMSVRASFPRFVDLEQEHGSLIRGMLKRMATMKRSRKDRPPGKKTGPKVTMFMTLKGGLSELIDELTGRIEGFKRTSIRTETTVAAISAEGGKYHVKLEGGEVVEADSVVIASPAHAASRLVKNLDPGLSEKLLTIPYVSTATISLAFRKKDVLHPLDGFGFVIPRTEKRKIMAATWTSRKFDHRAPEDSVLIRCFVGGSKNEDLVGLDDASMVDMVRGELKEIMGIDAPPVLARVYRWVNSMPQYTIGHEERIRSIEEHASTHPGLFLTGSAYHGIGIADSVRYGEVTAKKVLHYLAQNPG